MYAVTCSAVIPDACLGALFIFHRAAHACKLRESGCLPVMQLVERFVRAGCLAEGRKGLVSGAQRVHCFVRQHQYC